MKLIQAILWTLFSVAIGAGQQTSHHPDHRDASQVPLQPLAQQVRQIETALTYLGQPLSETEQEAINAAIAGADEPAAVKRLQEILDPHVLVVVDINPESRVKVKQGAAPPNLMQEGTRLFLVKVINSAGVTAPLQVESPNSGRVSIRSTGNPSPASRLTAADVREKWADITLFNKPPLRERLSGLAVEYQLLQIYSRDSGQRSAQISFNVGQGTQDVGFRNDVAILFNASQAYPVALRVRDEKGEPTVASFVIRDRLNRLYPNPSKRLAPDFPFQSQIYRKDGDVIHLPSGQYTITCARGPEYLSQAKELVIKENKNYEVSFELKRWIDPSKLGWYSGDHHIHAAGCSHYENPTEGVRPEDMWNQIQGEALNVGCVLTWGPCYYYQKQFFSGKDHPLSKPDQLIHYDLEVSGFPSSHSGHLVLLRLTEQDFPGTKRIEDWPTWDLPILKWGRAQNAVVGFAHSGWGLAVKSAKLPNYEIPGFDGIGANEYIVDVTHPNSVDFISAGDTPYVWELNIWYHTLNVGFRTRISGETDFPCIYDDGVGLGRTYSKVDGALNYADWVEAIRKGRSYVSDGRSHLIDFAVNGTIVGENDEIQVQGTTLRATVKASAYLDPAPDRLWTNEPYDQKPYWNLGRARIGRTREVPVELVVNGEVVARKTLVADGAMRELEFEFPLRKSGWIAARILPSSHTNPIFAIVDGKPVRASRQSAEWCLAAVNQCWTQKAPRISAADQAEAKKAYDHARQVYEQLIAECK